MAGVTALFVHGVGHAQAGFSVEARRNLRSALTAKSRRFYALEAVWGVIADRIEDEFLASAEAHGASGNFAQRFVVGTIADGTLWPSNAGLRSETFALIDAQLARLYTPPVVFAHSLGCLVMLDYLRERPNARIASLFTMGFNVALYAMGQPFDCPAQLREPLVWTNIVDPTDALGFPARSLPGFDQVRDVKVKVGGWFDRWAGLSHVRYWDSKPLWQQTIPFLMR